ncbi:MAG TPA: hypothetical protein VIM02_12155 [Rhizomicrobium sp.]|jgi:hypothetical protein
MTRSGIAELAGVAILLALSTTSAEARFLQADPAGYKDSPNLYEYVNDDPGDKSDPSGKTIQLMQEEQRKPLEKMINSMSHSQYKFNRHRKLAKVKGANKGDPPIIRRGSTKAFRARSSTASVSVQRRLTTMDSRTTSTRNSAGE